MCVWMFLLVLFTGKMFNMIFTLSVQKHTAFFPPEKISIFLLFHTGYVVNCKDKVLTTVSKKSIFQQNFFFLCFSSLDLVEMNAFQISAQVLDKLKLRIFKTEIKFSVKSVEPFELVHLECALYSNTRNITFFV